MNAKKIDQEKIEESQKSIAILQLGSAEDLLKTIQAASFLKEDRPELKLLLIAQKQIEKEVSFLTDNVFTKTLTIDSTQLFDEDDFSKTIKKIQNKIIEVNKEDIDVFLNLTFSEASSYFTTLVKAKHKLGLSRSTKNFEEVPDQWSQYIYSTIMQEAKNSFNIVDLFRDIIGTRSISKNIKNEIVHDHSDQQQKAQQKLVICPFAQDEKDAWKLAKWTEVIYKVTKEFPHVQVSLIGEDYHDEKAQSLVEHPLLSQHTNRIENLVGKLNLKEIHNLISDADLYIDHNSIFSHLAAFTTTSSIAIASTNRKSPQDVPYKNNQIYLSPKKSRDVSQCNVDISHQLVSTIIKGMLTDDLTEEFIKENCSSLHLNSSHIYTVDFNENDRILLNPVFDDFYDFEKAYGEILKIGWLFLLNQEEEHNKYPSISEQTAVKISKLIKPLQHLYELSEFNKKYSEYILKEIATKTPDIEKIKGYSKKIDEISDLQIIVKESQEELAPIINFFSTKKANLLGDNVVELTESSYVIANDFSLFCSLLNELLEKVIAEYKINKEKVLIG